MVGNANTTTARRAPMLLMDWKLHGHAPPDLPVPEIPPHTPTEIPEPKEPLGVPAPTENPIPVREPPTTLPPQY
jgi:hypothetical protein